MVCIREVQKSLEQSVKRLIEDKISAFDLGSKFDVQKFEVKTPGGGIIIFQGMQDHTAESIKSLEGYDVAWVEEAQSLSQRSLDLLRPTIRKPGSEIWFSWNPDREKDPVDLFLRSPNRPENAIVIEANWQDNPWFPQELLEEKDYDRRRDPDKYAHVWLGGYQKNSEARVFRNWRIDELDVPAHAKRYWGADWGFSVDPTTLVGLWIWDRTIYVDLEAYKVGCEIDQTPDLFLKILPKKHERITADNARPETISYMNRNGFRISPAGKGKGSVEDGIAYLKAYDIVVHPGCRHAIDELTLYAYQTDRKTGEILTDLEDKNNHIIDAMRYAVEALRKPLLVPITDEMVQRSARGF